MNLKECARTKAYHFTAVLTIASYFICSILIADANIGPLVCLNRSETLDHATGVVTKWLNHTVNQQSSDNRPNFLIQGWRWHTLSLIRDLERLRLFSECISSDISTERISEEDMKQFKSASDFVIDFNMEALYRIEEKTFFPWLQKKVLAPSMSRNIPDAEAVKEYQQAFRVILEYLAQERNKIKNLGRTLKGQVYNVIVSPSRETGRELSNRRNMKQSLLNSSSILSELQSSLQSSYQVQQNAIVPWIAYCVPLSEQKTLNKHVLRTLGLLESRTHLVGMYDTLQSISNVSMRNEELDLFRDIIPWIPRQMIPRWRTSLYEPKVGRLNSFQRSN